MKQTTKYVGLDVHQATTVTAVREESGRVIARSVLPTDASALLECFRGMRGAIHVAFEEGTQAQWLHDLLVPSSIGSSSAIGAARRNRATKAITPMPRNWRTCSAAAHCAQCITTAGGVPHSRSWRGRIRISSRMARG